MPQYDDIFNLEFLPMPGVEKQLLVPSTELSPKNSEGSAIVLKDDRILFTWTQFMETELMPEDERPPVSPNRGGAISDDGYARVAGIISEDAGRTWSEPHIVADDRDALVNTMSPGLTRLANGNLLLAYSWRSGGNADKEHPTNCKKMVRISEDEGQTWSERQPVTIPDGGYQTGCHDRAYTLSTGRVLVQCHTIFPSHRKEMGNYVARSDDNGVTWERSEILTEEKSRLFEEASIVERADGSLLMVMRSSRGNSYFTESTDGGETWSTPYPSGVIAPMAPTLLKRLPDSEDIVMIWNPHWIPWAGHHITRCPLLCAVSRDGGRTWGLPKAIEVNPEWEWAYPGMIFHEGTALLHYHRSHIERRGREMVLARIPVEWFTTDNDDQNMWSNPAG
jgi:sialidase-1